MNRAAVRADSLTRVAIRVAIREAIRGAVKVTIRAAVKAAVKADRPHHNRLHHSRELRNREHRNKAHRRTTLPQVATVHPAPARGIRSITVTTVPTTFHSEQIVNL